MVEGRSTSALQAQSPPRSLVVAVPELDTYQAHTGIGRVLYGLSAYWGERVRLVHASFEAYDLPVLRNIPLRVRPPAGADLVLLPKLTGAQALHDTGGVPSAVIVHDIGIVDFGGDREGLGWLTYRTILQSFRALRYAAHIIAVSRFTRDRLAHYLPELGGRITVIPSGVSEVFLEYRRSPLAARQRIEAVLRHPLGSPLLVYVGSELPRKNITLLLHVFKQVKNRHPGAQLLKVGKPGHARWRQKTVRVVEDLGLQIGKDVQIVEDVHDLALADAYRAADAFVSTSLYEGFGLPALEALAVGTPVVVTNCGAFAEVVGGVGRVVAPEIAQVVRAVDQALADPPSEERRIQGRARAAAFTWRRAADKYVEILQTVQ